MGKEECSYAGYKYETFLNEVALTPQMNAQIIKTWFSEGKSKDSRWSYGRYLHFCLHQVYIEERAEFTHPDTKSAGEAAGYDQARIAGIPTTVNVKVGNKIFDQLNWLDEDHTILVMATEFDSTGDNGFHKTDEEKANDKFKDDMLKSLGIEVFRYNIGRLLKDPIQFRIELRDFYDKQVQKLTSTLQLTASWIPATMTEEDEDDLFQEFLH